jgi:hypothetical protein
LMTALYNISTSSVKRCLITLMCRFATAMSMSAALHVHNSVHVVGVCLWGVVWCGVGWCECVCVCVHGCTNHICGESTYAGHTCGSRQCDGPIQAKDKSETLRHHGHNDANIAFSCVARTVPMPVYPNWISRQPHMH